MNNNDVVHDFIRRWNRSFVFLKLKQKSEESLVYIREVEYDENKVGVIHLDSKEYGALTINLGSADHSLIFKYPKPGVFQHGTQALCYRRIPARQWRRGICGDNSRISTVVGPLLGNAAGLSMATVADAFKHKTYSVEQALEALAKNRARSVALDENLSLALPISTDSTDYLVIFWDNLVGRCDANGHLTKVFEPSIKPILDSVFN